MLDINPKEEKKVEIEIEKEDDTNFDIPQSVVINWGLEVKEFQEWDEYLFWRVKGWERQEMVSIEEIRGYNGTDWVDGIDWLDWYTPMKWVDYFDWVDWKDGKNGKDWKDWKDWINGVDAYDMFLKEWGQDIGRQQFSEILRRNIEANWTIIWGNNWVQSITAWSNITVDNTDPRNPIISATGWWGWGWSVDSVFGRTWVVTAQSWDYTSDQVTETATRVFVTPTEKTAITHSNRAVLDATTASFTTADETKLDWIEALAEVNNISDANATDLTDWGTTSLHNHDDIYTRTSSLWDLATLDTVDTAQIENHAVTNTKLEQMNANTVKGRLSGNGTPQDIDMADLPISTATQTALDWKQATIWYTPENVANKSTSTSLWTSDTLYPSQNAVKSYVDTWLWTKQATLVSWTNIKTINGSSILWSWDLVVWWAKQHRITIPWEQVQDTASYQGLYFYNDTGATITISNVAVAVGKAAAWSWAAYSVNIYKSSWTAADWLNTSAVALFSSAIALTTSYTSLTNTPDTTTVESGRWVTMRITSSAGATNKASDAQIIITYS